VVEYALIVPQDRSVAESGKYKRTDASLHSKMQVPVTQVGQPVCPSHLQHSQSRLISQAAVAPADLESTSEEQFYVDSDFPANPPRGCKLSQGKWIEFAKHMKACGGPGRQRFSDEQLNALGYSSWKDYKIRTMLYGW
jgi:hypothetical protein